MAYVRLVRAALLEEALQHLHRGSLAEPARAREEHYARALRQQVAHEQRLVDAVAMPGDLLPVALADRKRKLPVAKVSRLLFHVEYYTKNQSLARTAQNDSDMDQAGLPLPEVNLI